MSDSRRFLHLVLMVSICVGLPRSSHANECQKRVVASVVDQDGNAVSGLGPTAFRAELRGQELGVMTTSPSSATRRVVILVDLSGSSTGVSKIAKALAENLVASSQVLNLRPAVVLFSDHIIDSIGFSHSPEEVAHKLDQLPESKGPTALLDALKYGADLFGDPSLGDSVYLISDGGENASKVRRSDVEREFLEKGIRIYTFHLALSLRGLTEEGGGIDLLRELSDLTGGEALNPELNLSRSGQNVLGSELQKMYQHVAMFYELQLAVPSQLLGKERHWNLEVLDGKGKKRKDVRVIYPHQLTPCSL